MRSIVGAWRVPAVVLGVAAAGTALAACGSSSDDGGPKAQKHYNIAVVSGSNDPFYVSLNCGVKAEAAKIGASVNVQLPPNYSVTAQVPLLNAAIARRPDALIVSPTDNKALIAPLKAAAASGIKVITADTNVDDTSAFLSYISSDEIGGGFATAKSAVATAKERGRSGPVLAISTSPSIGAMQARVDGFTKYIKEQTSLKLLPTQYNAANTATAFANTASAALQRNPDISIIFASWGAPAEGAVAAVKQAGLRGKVTVATFDAEPNNVKMIADGDVAALGAQQPYAEGVNAFRQAVNALQGRPVKPLIQTAVEVISQADVGSARTKQLTYSRGSCAGL